MDDDDAMGDGWFRRWCLWWLLLLDAANLKLIVTLIAFFGEDRISHFTMMLGNTFAVRWTIRRWIFRMYPAANKQKHISKVRIIVSPNCLLKNQNTKKIPTQFNIIYYIIIDFLQEVIIFQCHSHFLPLRIVQQRITHFYRWSDRSILNRISI